MPATNPRINVTLERPIYQAVQRLAKENGESLSEEVRDLVREALEIYEDRVLGEFAYQRERTFDRRKALTHEEVWGCHRATLKKIPNGKSCGRLDISNLMGETRQGGFRNGSR